jgi:hypothetical protein
LPEVLRCGFEWKEIQRHYYSRKKAFLVRRGSSAFAHFYIAGVIGRPQPCADTFGLAKCGVHAAWKCRLSVLAFA